MKTYPSQITLACLSAVCALVALSSVASAQGAFACKTTETQPECHARLKCKANEELEDCQKRLASQGGQRDDNRGDDNRGDDNRRDDNRGDNRRDDNDRGDRGDRDDDNDRGRGRGRDDDNDRGRDDDDGRGRSSRSRGRRGSSKGFQANKTFGLGLELGEPTGLNGKYFVSDAVALDFGVGWIYNHYYYGDGLHLYADFLWHPTSLVSAAAFELPFYVGVGLRYWDFEYCDRGLCTFGGSAIGLRVPVGISFDFNNVPLDIFIQLVPVVDFVNGDYYDRYRDRAHFGIDLSAGIRYWFK